MSCVVSVDGSLEVSFRVFAAGAHSIQRYFIDVGRIAGRVDLNVLAAGVHQFLNHLTLNGDDVGRRSHRGLCTRSAKLPI